MILLGNETLELVAGSAEAIDCVFEFEDGSVKNFTHDQANVREVISGPTRVARMILTNTTANAQTLTLRKSVHGQKTYQLFPSINLAAGEAVAWEPGTGLVLYDATGRRRINTA